MNTGSGPNTASMLVTMGLAMLLLAGCGQPAGTPSTTTASTPEVEEADGDSFGICRMLTAGQVAGVLPGSDRGSATNGGGSLIEGVDSWQCSYVAARDADLDLLTVIVTVAPDDALFEQIKVSGFAFDDDDAVAVGDSGWKNDGSADQFEVVANKGRSVLRISLMAPGAQGKAGQMIALAQAVAAKL
jgi:hypothetical protein